MAASGIPVLTIGRVAAANITQWQAVNAAGAVPAAAGNCLGFAQIAAASGERVPVAVLGTSIAIAGAAIAAGALLELDASGRVITRSAGAIIGRALEAAAVLGDQLEVMIIPN